MIKTINLKRLIKCLAIPQILGIIAALLTKDSKVIYSMIDKPPLSPPSWLFPVVWTLLYIFICIADYICTDEAKPVCKKARALYIAGLFINIIWQVTFFRFKMFTAAAVVAAVILLLAVYTAYEYYKCNAKTLYLYVPYIIWLIFALYLSVGVAVLN